MNVYLIHLKAKQKSNENVSFPIFFEVAIPVFSNAFHKNLDYEIQETPCPSCQWKILMLPMVELPGNEVYKRTTTMKTEKNNKRRIPFVEFGYLRKK